MIEFAHPAWLLLLPLPIVAWRVLPPYRERRRAVRVPYFEAIARATGATPRSGGVVRARGRLDLAILVTSWVLLVVALAEPERLEPPIERTESARDLMLALDLSGSMETEDMVDAAGDRASRITVVQEVLGDFVARREGDRIGLVIFGNRAFLQAPFTRDTELVGTLIDESRPRMAGPMTMLGDAIGLSVKAFEASEASDRVVLLLTDGKDTGSPVPPTKAAEIARSAGIVIHTIGFGDPTAAGEPDLDWQTIGRVSEITGGVFFRADDRETLDEITHRIDTLTPEELETTTFRPRRALFVWPLAASVLLGFGLAAAHVFGSARPRAPSAGKEGIVA